MIHSDSEEAIITSGPASASTKSDGDPDAEAEDSNKLLEDILDQIDHHSAKLRGVVRSALYAMWKSVKDAPFDKNLSVVAIIKQHIAELSPLCTGADAYQLTACAFFDLQERFSHAYEADEEIQFLHAIVSSSRLALYLSSPVASERPRFLARLCRALADRFERLGNPADIEDAIEAGRQSITLELEDASEKPRLFSNLGVSLEGRFNGFGKPADIEGAIAAYQSAVDLAPDGSADKPGFLSNLGNALESRFERTNIISDIDEAIAVKHQAVVLLPSDHPFRPVALNNLGNAHESRFERLGDLHDIEEAISAKRQAVKLMLDDHLPKSYLLSHLGGALEIYFRRTDHLVDIDEAIEVRRRAVDLVPTDHPDKPGFFSNLGNSLLCRFERLGDVTDIEGAISAYRRAIDLTPDTYPNKLGRMINMGDALELRFDRYDNTADIDEAISLKREAVNLTPDAHPSKPQRLKALGTALDSIFERFRNITDGDEAILVKRRAIKLTPDDHPNKAGLYASLGFSIGKRFRLLRELADADEAVASHQMALSLLPSDHPMRPGFMSNLGSALWQRAREQNAPTSFDEAIVMNRQAVALIPEGHPYKLTFLSDLGIGLYYRFKCTHNPPDIDEAITLGRSAVESTPDDHFSKAKRLTNLAMSLEGRFELRGDQEDFEASLSAYMRAATQDSSPPTHRLSAVQMCMQLCWRNVDLATYGRMLEVYVCALSLVPQVAWLGDSIDRRLDELADLGDIASAAAAVAVAAGKITLAIEWLEEGRSVVWSQLLQLRTPLDELRVQDAELAARLKRISRALESAGNDAQDHATSNTKPLEEVAVHRRSLAEEYKMVLATVREKRGFERFLLPRQLVDLLPSQDVGPIVVINAHESRCDALVVFAVDHIDHIPLRDLSLNLAEEMRSHLTTALIQGHVRKRGVIFEDDDESKIALEWILERLWTLIVQPVLLNIQEQLSAAAESKNLRIPRVVWCATGPLAFLPLHAAGIYGNSCEKTDFSPKIFEHIISSYTPTLSALSRTHMRPVNSQSSEAMRILIVSQADTPGYSILPGTVKEVENIKNRFSAYGLQAVHLYGQDATVNSVLRALDEYHPQIIHLACHGVQDSDQPTNSAFLLHDGRLSLSSLMTKTAESAELAFLSACETAAGDERLPEEAVHLTAGMLAVGYRSVIGSMWSIGDEDAPLVADEVYAHLTERNPVGSPNENVSVTVAHALHLATMRLREKVGEKDYLRWIPYIHFGL